MISNGDTDLQRLMARAEPTVPLMPMVAPVAGHWWGPLDGPQPAGSTEADVLRATSQRSKAVEEADGSFGICMIGISGDPSVNQDDPISPRLTGVQWVQSR